MTWGCVFENQENSELSQASLTDCLAHLKALSETVTLRVSLQRELTVHLLRKVRSLRFIRTLHLG